MSKQFGDAVHVPVLLREVVEQLKAGRGGMFLDCTFGGGGHTRAILDASPDNWVLAIDRDVRALERGAVWAGHYGERLSLQHGSFSSISDVVASAKFDGIIADLGVSTDQLREGRGFSFMDAESLDMRMNEGDSETAQQFINTASEKELYRALAEGGVGSNARQLARLLVEARPFSSAQHLAQVVRDSSLGKRSNSKVHPATVVFQAIRMKVNQEREQIEALLQSAPTLVKGAGSRLAVITFHSVEDALVARAMRGWESAGSYPASWRGERRGKKLGTLTPRKPIYPSDEEVSTNPASRSARLRVFEFADNSEFLR